MNHNDISTTKGMEQAQKAVEQARHKYLMAKKKANAERRKVENRHKYMMGGIVHKFFPECYSFDEKQLEDILEKALSSRECQDAISAIKIIKSQNGEKLINNEDYDMGE